MSGKARQYERSASWLKCFREIDATIDSDPLPLAIVSAGRRADEHADRQPITRRSIGRDGS